MKKLLIATAMATLPFGALAADLPVRSAAPAPAPMMVAAHNWTGFYLGAQAGFGNTYAKTPVYCSAASPSVFCPNASDTRSTNQLVLGGYLGYDHQIGSLVIGVEADGNLRFGSSDFLYVTGISGDSLVVGAHVSSDASARARLGALLTSRTLIYVTGGIAFGHVKAKTNTALDPNPTGWQTGWTVGAGVQYALDSNWSLRAEYRYTDYGSDRICANAYLDRTCGSFKVTDHKATIGVSYRFGGKAAPVVARY